MVRLTTEAGLGRTRKDMAGQGFIQLSNVRLSRPGSRRGLSTPTKTLEDIWIYRQVLNTK